MLATTVIVPCKGRLDSLKRSLEMMLDQKTSFEYNILVVDYGCPNDTFEYCQSLRRKNLICMKVLDNTEKFSLARSRNCGAKVAKTQILTMLDADCLLERDWLESSVVPVLSGQAVIAVTVGIQGSEGVSLVSVLDSILYISKKTGSPLIIQMFAGA